MSDIENTGFDLLETLEADEWPVWKQHNRLMWRRTSAHDLKIPEKAHPCDAGYDLALYCGVWEYVPLYAGEIRTVNTGWSIAIPYGYVGLIKDRSGMALNGVTTRAGVIDSSYRGEIKIVLKNETEDIINIKNGERIAQLIVVPCLNATSVEVEELDETARADNGFGSTGS